MRWLRKGREPTALRDYPPTAVRAVVGEAEATTAGRAPELAGTLRLWARGRFPAGGW